MNKPMEEKIIKKALGIGGQLELLENKVRIKRKGALAFMSGKGFKGDKEIFIKDISSIQFKKAGFTTNGYIQFAFYGGQETKGGIWNATKDENTIMFNSSHQKEFEEIKSMIDEMKARPEGERKSGLDDLEKLAELKQKGIITQEEFDKKKKEILGV